MNWGLTPSLPFFSLPTLFSSRLLRTTALQGRRTPPMHHNICLEWQAILQIILVCYYRQTYKCRHHWYMSVACTPASVPLVAIFNVITVVAVISYLSVITLAVACLPQRNARYSQHCCHLPHPLANHLSSLGVATWSCLYHLYCWSWSSLHWLIWLNVHHQLCSDYKAVALFRGQCCMLVQSQERLCYKWNNWIKTAVSTQLGCLAQAMLAGCGNCSTKSTQRLIHNQTVADKKLPFNCMRNQRI